MSGIQEQPKIIERMKESPYLQDESVNFIFNNLRNVGLSILPIIAAKAYVKEPLGDSVWLVWLVVLSSIAIALLLLLLNIFHAWRKISELHIPLWIRVSIAVFYAYAIAMGFELLIYAKQ